MSFIYDFKGQFPPYLAFVITQLWQSVIKNLTPKFRQWVGLTTVMVATVTVTSLFVGIRQMGGLQSLEVIAYDRMVQLRSDEPPDPRLLIVGITDSDIQFVNQWPLSDRLVAQLLANLSELNPAVIGLDLYRDIPYQDGQKELKTQFQKHNIIAIRNLGDAQNPPIRPPKGVPEERIGFNDFVLDRDGVIRRNLMFASNQEGETFFSFSLQLVLHYLAPRNITPENSSTPDHILWGKAEFTPLTANTGNYQNLDDQGYQILLNYRSDQALARSVSLQQVLTKQVDPSWVQGKIVLIGATAASAKDLFLTPYSPGTKTNPKMAGVLVHAHMVSQLLDAILGERPLFIFWPEWAEILWIASWALIGATFAWCSRHPLIAIFGSPILLGILLILSFYLFLESRWVPVVTPGLAFGFTSGIVIAYRSHQAQQQKQIVMRLLGQNTSPEVAEALWSNRDDLLAGGKLPGKRLTATLLFTDLKDFSTISESMPPEDLLEWLNEYLAHLTQIVQDHHGIINKFTGDGIMAAFGVPVMRTTPEEIAADAKSAVACGLAMRERLMALNQDWQQRGLPVISMRVGIYTGPIVAGSLGGKDRLEYGLLGDTVNIASRLESCAKERQPNICRILIADETLVYIKDEYEVESWGQMTLKGKQQTVDVYHVDGRVQRDQLPDLKSQ